MSRRAVPLAVAGALGLWVLLGVTNLYRAELNQDEGWYLYAARSVAAGELPYRDFAFTQGPVLPFVYALAARWIEAGGVEAGRWITFLFGGLTLLGVFQLARRIGGPHAAAIATVLLAVNVYQSQFTTTVKTYALAGALLVWGLHLVLGAGRGPGVRGALSAGLGGLLLAAATGTRLSAAFAIPVVCGYLLLLPPGRGSRAWLWAGVGAGLGLLVIYLPFAVAAPDGLAFGLFEYHAGRGAGGLVSGLVYKAGFLSRMVQAYFVLCAVIVCLLLARWLRGPTPPPPPGAGCLWGVAGVITLVHLATPFPYDDYQAFVFPVACAAAGIAAARRLEAASVAPDGAMFALLLVGALAALSSPVNQSWFVGERDRIWWRLKPQGPLQALDDAAGYVRVHVPPGEPVLTQDLYLAVAANRRVPDGLEMGPFSYYPDMERARADRLGVLNRDALLELLRARPAPVAAISGYGLSIASPDVRELATVEQAELRDALHAGYHLDRSIEPFGQAGTRLDLYRRRPDP